MSIEKRLETKLTDKMRVLKLPCFKFTSTLSGVPDRIVFLRGGETVLIELKDRDEDFSPLQIAIKNKLARVGQQVWLVNSEESLAELISWIKAKVNEYA